MKSRFFLTTLFSAFLFILSTAAGCGEGENGQDAGDADMSVDLAEDMVPDLDVGVDDVPVDPPLEDIPGDALDVIDGVDALDGTDVADSPTEDHVIDCPPPEIPDTCELPVEDAPELASCPDPCAVVPSDGEIGAPCVSPAQCNFDGMCFTEDIEFYSGEMYITNPGGQCMIIGAGSEGCDPDIPETCPEGSRCLFLGTSMGSEYFGCFDTCSFADTSMVPYECNCGCREGYECSPSSDICFSGCSHDRECCEIWWDVNGDFVRSASEVEMVDGCTNICDDEPEGLLQATYNCINDGDPTNEWSGPCRGDPHCPPDGRCLDEFHYASDTGDDYFPGGLCLKDRCDLVGRGCGEHGGACVNLDTADDPFWACVGICHTGLELTEPGYECRTESGQEHACIPVEEEFWLAAPPCGYDGICWPGNFPGGTNAVGSPCTDADECISRLGLGDCVAFEDDGPGSCSASCNPYLAECKDVCGGADDAGRATGVCAVGFCFEACDTPDGPPGANGCTPSSMACYSEDALPEEYSHSLAAMPPAGICIPACGSSAWCETFWGHTLSCNVTTGVCHE